MSDTWEKMTVQLYKNDNYSRLKEVHEILLANIPPGQSLKILDIGCGDGSFLRKIDSSKNKLFGIDVSREQLSLAEKNGIKVQYHNIDNGPLPYEDNYFDVIICSEVIEHVLLPDNILREAYRTLTPNGRFLLTTPNLGSLGRRLFLLFNKNPFIENSPLEPNAVGHLRYFVYSALLALVKKYGFQLEKFTSDVINFSWVSWGRSKTLAKYFPSFGRTLIFVLKKK